MAIELISKSDEIAGFLTEVKVKKCQLKIKIHGEESSYSSTLVDFYGFSENPWILIAPLSPAEGNKIIAQASSVSVEFTLDNTYTFNSTYLGIETRNKDDFIKISYPEKRKFYRVVISTQNINQITLEIDPETKLTGYVKDISPAGVGFYIEGSSVGSYDLKKIHTITFELPDGTIIRSKVDIRYVKQKPVREGSYFFCGASFIDLDKDSFNKIVHFIFERKLKDEEI